MTHFTARTLRLLAVCLALVCLASALPAAVLYENGQVKSIIVIPDDATPPVRHAAAELARCLRQATGRNWPIGPVPRDGMTPIYLGDSEFARSHGFDRDALKPDGYFLKSTADYLLIAGRDYPGGALGGAIQPATDEFTWSPELNLCAFGEMGTFNGVARFLEKHLGIRWYMVGHWGSVVPPCSALVLPDIEMTDGPDFEYRYAFFCNFRDSLPDALWYRRIGLGGKAPVSFNHNFFMMQWQQNAHPEYFALIDGERDFTNRSVQAGGGNYCLTNTGLIQAWIDQICAFFEQNPDQEFYPLCPNDGLDRICECPDCQALNSPELGPTGCFSNYVWTFIDKVAQAVAERCPGKKIGCFAYEKYRVPPTVVHRLSPNVSVMICYNRFSMNDQKTRQDIRQAIETWSKKCDNIYFWTYPITDYQFLWRGMPVCYPHLIAEDIRANRDLGTKGEFLESEFPAESDATFHYFRISSPGHTHLNAYVTAKLLWDADTDVDALLDEYYRVFYGPAEDPMRRFWTKIEKIAMSRKFRWGIDPPKRFFSRDDILELYALLDEALAKTVVGSAEYARVGFIRQETKPYLDQILNAGTNMRTMAIPMVSSRLELTDDLQNTPWAQAAAYDFTAKDGSPANYPTKMLTAADDDGIAFTFICTEPTMDRIIAKCTKDDDGDIWLDDCLELFFSHADGVSYRHLIINAANAVWDSKTDGETFPEDSAWDSGCTHRTIRRERDWLVQMKLPWSDLGLQPGEDGNILTNIFRNRYAGEAVSYLAFSPSQAPMHRMVDYFVPLKVKRQ